MKAISAIIVVVLLLLISISLISVVYVWSSALTGSVTSTTEETTTELTKQLSSCLKIDAISKNQIYLRNCGKGVITNNSLSVFIDDVKVGHSLTEIGEDQTGTVNISGLWKFSMDRHNLKITNGAAFVQALIELEPNKDGLVGYWSFDEGSGNKVYDKSGNRNDGTLLDANAGNGDGNTPPQWVSGKFGNALSFDGIDDYVDAGNDASLNLGTIGTIEAWFKTSTTSQQSIFGKGGGWGLAGYYLTTISGNHIRLHWNSAGNEKITDSALTFNYGEWTHVVAGSDGNSHFIYINGIKDPNGNTNIQNTNSNYKAAVGVAVWNGNALPFNGIIDSVHIWNRALTPDETVVMKML